MLKNTTVTMSYEDFKTLQDKPKKAVRTISLRVFSRIKEEYSEEDAKKISNIIQEERDRYLLEEE